jgi:CubicO group peptidase (beta-lactamase class C family)
VFSTTKGITYTAIHILAERGLLDYDDPVARYWPAFAARGKSRVTIRQLLTHSAGVPQMPEGSTPEDLCDWDRICAPLGLRNLFFGIPDEAEDRVAFLEDGPIPEYGPEPMPMLAKAIPEQLPAAATLYNCPNIRRACIPAAGGIMNARDLARHYACLATGVDGVRLLPPKRVALIAQEQTRATDQVIGLNIRKGLGYFLHGENGESISDSPDSFGHPGAGGSVGYADPAHGLAVGFTKTRLTAPLERMTGSDVKLSAKIQEVLSTSPAL